MSVFFGAIAVPGSSAGAFWSFSLRIASPSGIGQSIATVGSPRASAG